MHIHSFGLAFPYGRSAPNECIYMNIHHTDFELVFVLQINHRLFSEFAQVLGLSLIDSCRVALSLEGEQP